MGNARGKRVLGLIVFQAAAFASRAWGQTAASWVNAVDGNWIDPTAWSTNPNYPNDGQPGVSDTYDAIIGATGGSYTVTLQNVIELHSLTMNAGSATLDQTGGTLSLTNGGSIGAGIFKIESLMLNLSGTLSNAATVAVTDGSIILNGATFNNLANGVVNISPGSVPFFSPFSGPPSGLITNAGTININGASNSIIALSYPMVSSGTLAVNSGTVQFSSGPFTWNSGAVITGAGFVDLGSTFANHVLNGNLTLSGSKVAMSGGTISGVGDLNETAGTFTWSGGTLSGFGAVNVSAGAVMNVGPLSSQATLSRVLNNSGTMNFTGGIVTFANGTINNQSGGVVNIATPPGSYIPYQFSGSPTASSFNNFGTMNVNTGSLIGGQSLSTTLLNGGLNDSGTIIVNAGTLMLQSGSFTYGPAAVIKGTSTIDFGKGTATQTVNGNLTLAGSNMIIDAGTFTGPGNIDVTGNLIWNAGTFTGTGTMAVAAGGSLSIASFSTHGLSRVLSNSGTVVFGAGSILLMNSGAFVNTANGVMNIVGSPQLSLYTPYSAFTGTAQFNNAGTMNINVGSNTGVQLPGPFVDSGTIAANSGSVTFSGGSYTWNGAATVMGAGTVEFSPFGSNTHVVNGDLTLAGTNMRLSNGTFSGPGNIEITGNLIWNNGSFSGSGTMAVGTTGVVSSGSFGARTLSRLLTNFGVFNFGNATLNLAGGTFVNAAGGTVNFNTTQLNTVNAYTAFSGTSGFSNSGWMNISPSGSTTLIISNPFVDYGTISANSGTLAFSFGTFAWNGNAVLTGASSIELGFNANNHIVNGNLTMAGTKISMGNGSFSGPGNENVTGVFNWNGGQFQGTGALNVMPGAAINFGQMSISRVLSQMLNNSGTATFTSALLMLAAGTFNNGPSGTVNITSPGTQTLFATGSIGPNLIKNAGTVSVGAGATTMQAPFVNIGSVTVSANGALNTTAGLTNAGTIDLSGILTVGYSGPMVLPTIEQQIISGFNGGIWKGIGIDSSSAASVAADVNNPHKTGIGYGEASTLGIVGTGTFAGQAVTDHTVIARYTYLGDANLDQTVNLLDLNAVATNFGQSGKVWTDGDSNYDGVVNMVDFNSLAMNFGSLMPLPPGSPPAEGGLPLGAIVPEPAAGILLEIAAIAWIGSRKRRICFTSQTAVH